MFHQKTLHVTWCMSRCVVWWSCQSPAVYSCALWITEIVSMEECSSLTQTLMQIHCFTHSIILNVTATQYTCSLNSFYCPHWLVQWGCHYSHMHIPVHSPWLPGYINVAQTILIILTTAGFFPDRPCRIPRSGIAGSHDSCVLNFLVNFHTVFHSSYTKLHSH